MTTVRQILKSKVANEVWTVHGQQMVREALRLMAEKNIGAVVVMQDGRIEGIFSERDYARKVVLMNRSSDSTRVSEVTTRNIYTVNPKTLIKECMTLMTDNRIRHLPVIENEKLIGIISLGDLVKEIISHQKFLIEELVKYVTNSPAYCANDDEELRFIRAC